MIHIQQLEFRYPHGEFTLRVDELEIESNRKVAIIGPSGSGKTTLLHLLAGIKTPQAGEVHVGEAVINQLSTRARRDFRIQRMGLVFQNFELLDYLSVLENILLPFRISPAMRLTREIKQRAAELADRVGMGDKLKRYANRLSQGERQRVAVCRALLGEPKLLLADEPTGNLDPANKNRVLKILTDYADRSGATLVAVTHDHDLLTSFDRVIDCKEFQHLPQVTAASEAAS